MSLSKTILSDYQKNFLNKLNALVSKASKTIPSLKNNSNMYCM